MDRFDKKAVKSITYASSAQTRLGRVFVKFVENVTGRLSLISRAKRYYKVAPTGHNFWEAMLQCFGISLENVQSQFDKIPKDCPLVIVANHPYGILDGLVMGHILSHTRGDFRILANSVFSESKDITDVILPISFDETKEAVALNMQTRKTAVSYLKSGGAIGVFPGGTVSTSKGFRARPLDPLWRNFTAKMISKSGATVVPIYFEGANSRLFQWASRTHYTLRIALLIFEFRRRVGTDVQMVVGDPILPETLAEYAKDPKKLMAFLRQCTYALAQEPVDHQQLGYEFEEKYKASWQ